MEEDKEECQFQQKNKNWVLFYKNKCTFKNDPEELLNVELEEPVNNCLLFKITTTFSILLKVKIFRNISY